jgi:hypothetical protein
MEKGQNRSATGIEPEHAWSQIGQIKGIHMPMKVVLFAAACLLLVAATLPAPLPYYLAINYATKQCGEYWGGDEFVTYKLPPGWNTYEYQYSASNWSVETPSGTCSVPQSLARSSFAEVCCSQLGYTYVSNNIGVYRLTAENIANQKAMEDYAAKQAAQARAERIQTIILYAIVLFSIALVVTIIVQWRHEKRKR